MEIVYEFNTQMRGYARREVDGIVERGVAAVRSTDHALRAAVRDELRAARFSVGLRGYDRAQVDRAIHDLVERLDAPVGA